MDQCTDRQTEPLVEMRRGKFRCFQTQCLCYIDSIRKESLFMQIRFLSHGNGNAVMTWMVVVMMKIVTTKSTTTIITTRCCRHNFLCHHHHHYFLHHHYHAVMDIGATTATPPPCHCHATTTPPLLKPQPPCHLCHCFRYHHE